jgi:hypothetical protein
VGVREKNRKENRKNERGKKRENEVKKWLEE